MRAHPFICGTVESHHDHYDSYDSLYSLNFFLEFGTARYKTRINRTQQRLSHLWHLGVF